MSTESVKYDGPYEAVELALPDGDVTVKHGESVEVSSEVAQNLLEQGTWSKSRASSPSKKED